MDAKVAKHQEELTYLWAEVLYKTEDLDQAKSKFSWLIEKFPNSRWVPEALYAIGEITYQQENCEEALQTFQKLVTEFPQSEFEKRAESRIVELNQVCGEPDPPIPDPIPPCEEMYKRASDLQQRDKNYDAHELYTDLISQCPESEYVIDAYVRKAEIHLDAKNYVKARANYEEAIYSTTDAERKRELYAAYHRTYLVPVYSYERIWDSDSEPFTIAELLRLEKRWLEAAETYGQLANDNLPVEDIIKALYWMGICYHKEDSTNLTLLGKSAHAFRRFISDHDDTSNTIEVYYHLTLVYRDYAEVSEDVSKYQMVINTATEASEKYAESNDPRYRGWLNRIRGLKDEAYEKLNPLKDKAESAVKAAQEAIAKLQQENIDSQRIRQANEHLEEAKRQMSINNYEETISEAKKVLEEPIPPPPFPDPQRYVDEGSRYFEQNKLEKALEKAEQALEINLNCAPARELKSKIKERYYNHGLTLFDEERYDAAIEAFENAISIDIPPKLKEPYNYLGVIYIGQEKYREAIEAFAEAIKIDENFKEAYFNRALAHLELGEFEAAIENAEAALRIDPNYESPRMLKEFIIQYNPQ